MARGRIKGWYFSVKKNVFGTLIAKTDIPYQAGLNCRGGRRGNGDNVLHEQKDANIWEKTDTCKAPGLGDVCGAKRRGSVLHNCPKGYAKPPATGIWGSTFGEISVTGKELLAGVIRRGEGGQVFFFVS